MSRIKETFSRLKAGGKKAFIPYIMAGDPDLEKTGEYVRVLSECGADIIELGVPFSDPLADGPTIQMAAERALKAGITLPRVIPFVKKLRQHAEMPLVLMTYYNPILKYGEERFVQDAVNAGVDGVIIPDLPPEEAGNLIRSTRIAKIDTIFLIAPTSTEERIRRVVSASRGFVYYVSITGTTGSKLALGETFKDHLGTVKLLTDKPVAVGFGVSTPEDARAIAQIADGIIVGSAIVKKFHEDPTTAREFIQKIRDAI